MSKLRALIPDLPREAWLVLGGGFASALGSGLTLPFFLVYLHLVRGIDLELAGVALSTVALAGLVGNPLGGWLSDRVGARSALVAGLLVNAAGALSLVFVRETWQALAAAALVGLGASLVWPAEDSLLAVVVPPPLRSSVYAVHHATLNAGFGIGAVTSAAIVDAASPRSFELVYVLDAASFVLFAGVLSRLRVGLRRPEHEAATGGYRQVFADPVFLELWAVMALLVISGYAQFHAAFPAYATGPGGLSARALGFAFGANMLTVVVFQLFALRVMAGRRRTRGLLLVCASFALTWAVTLVAATTGGALVAALLFATAMALLGLGETFVSPTVPALVNDLAPDRLRGRYNGAFTLAWTSGFIVGPLIAGFALGAGHGRAFFVGLICACGLAALGALDLERRLPAAANLGGVTAAPEPLPVPLAPQPTE
ncbi:MAG TPA: MFS transporter [Gaiellaceae bacterium]|nr:MFS transporter [Gaiellaceae bacterium]